MLIACHCVNHRVRSRPHGGRAVELHEVARVEGWRWGGDTFSRHDRERSRRAEDSELQCRERLLRPPNVVSSKRFVFVHWLFLGQLQCASIQKNQKKQLIIV